MSEPLDLEAIKRSSRAGGGTVDDVEDLIAEVERQAALLHVITAQINDLTWFTAYDPAKKLWQVSDEHSIGERIERLREMVATQGDGRG